MRMTPKTWRALRDEMLARVATNLPHTRNSMIALDSFPDNWIS